MCNSKCRRYSLSSPRVEDLLFSGMSSYLSVEALEDLAPTRQCESSMTHPLMLHTGAIVTAVLGKEQYVAPICLSVSLSVHLYLCLSLPSRCSPVYSFPCLSLDMMMGMAYPHYLPSSSQPLPRGSLVLEYSPITPRDRRMRLSKSQAHSGCGRERSGCGRGHPRCGRQAKGPRTRTISTLDTVAETLVAIAAQRLVA
jgi:hypothetical protein